MEGFRSKEKCNINRMYPIQIVEYLYDSSLTLKEVFSFSSTNRLRRTDGVKGLTSIKSSDINDCARISLENDVLTMYLDV